MKGNKAIRVGPQNAAGEQLASAWRIWSQGDNFFAAPRNLAQFGKISFHPGYRWQHRIGNAMKPLPRPPELVAGWRLALRLSFLITENTLPVPLDSDPKVRLVIVPTHHKLVVDLWLQSEPAPFAGRLPQGVAGQEVASIQLRAGRWLFASAFVASMSHSDAVLAAEQRAKIRAHFDDVPPKVFFCEAMLLDYEEGNGNFVTIVPLGTEAIDVRPSVRTTTGTNDSPH